MDINYLQNPENLTKQMKEIWRNSCDFLIKQSKPIEKGFF